MTSPPPAPAHYPPCTPPAANRLPNLADKGCTGAGIGIAPPPAGPYLAPDIQTPHRLINAQRAPAERADAGTISAAAIVLTTVQRGR